MLKPSQKLFKYFLKCLCVVETKLKNCFCNFLSNHSNIYLMHMKNKKDLDDDDDDVEDETLLK